MGGRIFIVGLLLLLAVPMTDSVARAFTVSSLRDMITGRQKSLDRIEIPVGKTNRASISLSKGSLDGRLPPAILGPEWSLTGWWDKDRKAFVLGVKRSF